MKQQKVREQGIRFWDKRTFWNEIILECRSAKSRD